jgi:hypothetical protein
VQELFSNPCVLRDLLDRQLKELDRLVDRAMKKKPQPEIEEQELGAVAGV